MKRKKEKKSFLVMKDLLDPVKIMTDEEAGKLLRAVISYWDEEEISLPRELSFAFASIKNQFDRDWDKYLLTSERNKINGAKGGKQKAKKHTDRYRPLPTATDRNRSLANLADTDTDTDTDTDKPTPTSPYPDWLNTKAWDEFERHRRDIRKPLSVMSAKKNMSVLEKHKDRQQEIIDATIANRWAGLFQPKGGNNEAHQQSNKPSLAERATAARKEYERDHPE